MSTIISNTVSVDSFLHTLSASNYVRIIMPYVLSSTQHTELKMAAFTPTNGVPSCTNSCVADSTACNIEGDTGREGISEQTQCGECVNVAGWSYIACVHCGRESDSPFLLCCLHLMCEGCIHSREVALNNKVTCTLCGNVSTLAMLDTKSNQGCVEGSGCGPIRCISLAQTSQASKQYQKVFNGQKVLCMFEVCTSPQEQACYLCLNCNDFLCNSCFALHQRMVKKLTGPHTVKSFQEVAGMNFLEFQALVNDTRAVMCPQHNNLPLLYFCDRCNVLLCQACVLEQAQSPHQPKYLNEEHTIPHIRRLHVAREVVDCTREGYRTSKREAEAVTTAIKSQEEETLRDIEKAFQRLHTAINERKAEVCRDVQIALSDKMKTVDETKNGLEKGDDFLSHSKAVLDLLLASRGSPDVVSCARLASMKQEALVSHQHRDSFKMSSPAMQFIGCNENNVLEAIQSFGRVECGPEPSNCTISSLPKQVNIVGSTPVILTLTSNNGRNQPWEKGGEKVEGYLRTNPPTPSPSVKANVVDHNNGTYSVSFPTLYLGPCEVSVFLNNSHISGSPFVVEFLERCGFPLTRDPKTLKSVKGYLQFPHPPGGLYGIAVSAKGTIFVGDHGNHKIHVFDRDRRHVNTFGCHGSNRGELRFPNGMALDGLDHLYVANCENNRIEVFNANGGCLKRLGRNSLTHPTDVAINHHQVYVADSGNHRIAVFSLRGDLISTFGTKGGGPGQFEWPSSLVFSPAGELFVADCNRHRVLVLTADGKFLREFGKGNLYNPLDILIAADGSVLVNDTGYNRIAVFNGDSGALLHTFPASSPYGLAVDSQGDLLVTDFCNKRVAIF